VIIDHREASDVDQLPTIAGELVQKKVAVISGPANAIVAGKAQTTAIPMVFIGAADPVALGLVSSFNRPGGNVTGVLFTAGDLPSKQIEIVHELVPTATKVGLLINPRLTTSEPQAAAASAAADAVGITVTVERVVAENESEVAFEHFAQSRVGAILAIANLFFLLHRDRLAELALARAYHFYLNRGSLPLPEGSRVTARILPM
jgi:putative ABC transport system substrate-binding protein